MIKKNENKYHNKLLIIKEIHLNVLKDIIV